MPEPFVPINLAAEDELSEAVQRKLLKAASHRFAPGRCYRKGGFGYLKKNISGFNHAATCGTPFFVLTDLDRKSCAPELRSEWLAQPDRRLIFRVAVREVEAWLLADHERMAKFLAVPRNKLPGTPELLPDPKAELVRLAGRSRRRDIRDGVAPPKGSLRVQGPTYNLHLRTFVEDNWDPEAASQSAPSLAKALQQLRAFRL